MNMNDMAALCALDKRGVCPIAELPRRASAKVLLRLDEAGLIEVRLTAMGVRRPKRPGKRPGDWFSPVQEPEKAGTWEEILAAWTPKDWLEVLVEGQPPIPNTTCTVRLTEKGRSVLAQVRERLQPDPEVLERIQQGLKVFREFETVRAEGPARVQRAVEAAGEATTGGPGTGESRGPVKKLEGWTKAELVSQVEGNFSGATFDNIRKAADVKASERGGRGQQRRYSPAELKMMIAAVERGTFRNVARIVESWRQLLSE